jgi:hypothetical protein
MRMNSNVLFEAVSSGIFAVLASVVLLYISISSGIGPWIAPIIVLAVAALGKVFGLLKENVGQRLVVIQAAGAHVGLLAVAIGFTVPTYFFVDRAAFAALITERPFMACAGLAVFIAFWSLIGTFVGQVFAEHFLQDASLKIPVAEVIKTTINASGEKKELHGLMRGVGLGGVLCVIREACIGKLATRFAQIVQFFSLRFIGDIGSVFVDAFAPSIWAVGFIAGPAMAFAFCIGMLSKFIVLKPLYLLIQNLNWGQGLSFEQSLVAVSSGLVLTELFVGAATVLFKGMGLVSQQHVAQALSASLKELWQKTKNVCGDLRYELLGLSCCAGLLFFWAIGISSIGLLIYLVLAIGMAVYQMTLIAGNIGLVQFGRFATFVMLPALVFFSVTPVQAIIISVVVSVVGAAASNILFQFRLADDFKIARSTMYKIQLVSSVLGAVSVAVVFWLLCSHLTLGTQEFFAFRGYSRALLIQSFNFDVLSVGIGLLFGLILRYTGAAPSMVLGGLLMPPGLVVAFVLGAAISYFVKNPREHMATASGVFAAEAVWIFVRILLRYFSIMPF